MKIKKAFTMAEAILVMTILGIIATIMITTLKPAEFKEKGLRIMAKKILSEIDTATTQVLINNTKNGSMAEILVPTLTNGASYSFGTTGNAYLNYTAMIYKKYLTATRQNTTGSYCAANAGISFYLKDGACIGFKHGGTSYDTIFPGETGTTSITNATHSSLLGAIYVDTNGDEEPNTIGKDRFLFPVGTEGILYEN